MSRRSFQTSAAIAGIAAAIMISIALLPAAGATRLTWRVEVVDGDGNAGRGSSLAIAGNGTLYVLYQDEGGGLLRLATRFSGSWSFEDIAGEGFYLGDTSLMLDARGTLHAVYFDAISNAVRYGTRDASGGPWSFADVDSGYGDGFGDLDLDQFGGPHIVYTMLNGTLRYAYRSDSFWVREYVDPATLIARYETLELDRSGRPHIAYYGNGQLRYASKPGAEWNIEVADQRDKVGWFAHIGLDSRGVPGIAYYDSIERSLIYATRTPATWSLSVVDDVGDPGLGISLVVGPDDRPRIAYYVRIPSELRYAEPSNRTWEIQTVDDEGIVGWEPSLAYDSGGTPHVSYYDWTRGALRLATGLPVLGARTVGATDLSPTAGVLQGEVTSLGGYALANVSFDWRRAGESIWRNTTEDAVDSAAPFEAHLEDLEPEATYEFRAVVEAGGITETGRVLTFTTRSPARLDLALIALVSVGTAVAAVGLSVATYVWLRGPIFVRKRGGTRPGGQA